MVGLGVGQEKGEPILDPEVCDDSFKQLGTGNPSVPPPK
jgi:hypothetical protein